MAVTDFIIRFTNSESTDTRPGTFSAIKQKFIIAENAINNTSLAIDLCGKSVLNSTNILNNNLAHLLENFCSNSEPRAPTEGQFWYDTSDKFNHDELGRLKIYLPQKKADGSVGNVFVDVAGTVIDINGHLRHTGQIEAFYESDYNAIPQDQEINKAFAPENDDYYKFLTTKRHCDENYYSGFYMQNPDKIDEDAFYSRSDRKVKYRVENNYFLPKDVKDYTALVTKKYVDDSYLYGVYDGVTDISTASKPLAHTIFTIGDQLAKVNYTATFSISLPKSLQDRLQVPTKGYLEDNFLYGTYTASTDYTFTVGSKVNQIKYTQLTLSLPKDNTDLLVVPDKGYVEDNFLYGRYADSNATFNVGDLVTRVNYHNVLTISLPKVANDLTTLTDKQYVEDNFLYGRYADGNATFNVGALVTRINYDKSLTISLPKLTNDLTTVTDKKYVEDNFLYGLYTDSNATFTLGNLVTKAKYAADISIGVAKDNTNNTTIVTKKFTDDNYLYGTYKSSTEFSIGGNMVLSYETPPSFGSANDGSNTNTIITKNYVDVSVAAALQAAADATSAADAAASAAGSAISTSMQVNSLPIWFPTTQPENGLLYSDKTGATVTSTLGTADQIIKVKSDGSGVEWVDVADLSGSTSGAWVDLKATRTSNTEYTNSSTNNIIVNLILGNTPTTRRDVTVNGVLVGQTSTDTLTNISFMVPPGGKYKYAHPSMSSTSGEIIGWAEFELKVLGGGGGGSGGGVGAPSTAGVVVSDGTALLSTIGTKDQLLTVGDNNVLMWIDRAIAAASTIPENTEGQTAPATVTTGDTTYARGYIDLPGGFRIQWLRGENISHNELWRRGELQQYNKPTGYKPNYVATIAELESFTGEFCYWPNCHHSFTAKYKYQVPFKSVLGSVITVSITSPYSDRDSARIDSYVATTYLYDRGSSNTHVSYTHRIGGEFNNDTLMYQQCVIITLGVA